jgi:predicted metal-dependent hydrolase
VESSFKRGLQSIREGRFFEAHEELEDAWRAAAAEERDFFQGLVHVAVAWYQAGRGKPVATARQLEKAARRLGPYAPVHRGVDVADVLRQVDSAQRRVAEGSLELDPPRL